jgi:hypothetical protein
MAPKARAAVDGNANWAVSHVVALIELWSIIAEHSGLVGAWRLMGVCTAAREGAKSWLRTLPRFVVCGGKATGGNEATDVVWRLDLGELQWEHSANLTCDRSSHACCVVRGGIVVLCGEAMSEDLDAYVFHESVEVLQYHSQSHQSQVEEQGAYPFNTVLPPLSCDARTLCDFVVLAIDESRSDAGQVLHIGGRQGDQLSTTDAMHKVDLATGVCTPQTPLLHARSAFAAGRLPDGRIVCAGGVAVNDDVTTFFRSAEILEPVLEPVVEGGSTSGASWRWRELPLMSVARIGCGGCILLDGRFAVFGGNDESGEPTASCEALTLDTQERWEALNPEP